MIEVQYKCQCLDEERSVWIKNRHKNESAESVIDRAARAVSDDHSSVRPYCRAPHVEYCKIPVSASGLIAASCVDIEALVKKEPKP